MVHPAGTDYRVPVRFPESPSMFVAPPPQPAPSSRQGLASGLSFQATHHGVTFSVSTDGTPQSHGLLFPESGIPLDQAASDPAHFRQRLQGLRQEERQAIQWAMVGQPADVLQPVHKGMQVEAGLYATLNSHLANGIRLDPGEWSMMRDLSSALGRLPPVPGEYLRVVEYRDLAAIPWGTAIQVGDLVTNHPCFMSTTPDDSYAKWAVGEYACSAQPYALVFCRIGSATSGVPLWPGVDARPGNPSVVLFPRDACFLVKSIARAQATGQAFPAMRIGVVLEQVAGGQPLRNLHSGEPVRVRTPW